MCKFDGHDECQVAANRETCLAAGQYCFDEDPELADDWVCHCQAPFSQKDAGIMAPAVCVLDECTAVCETCARKGDESGYACEGQLCFDDDRVATGDWRCECIAPAVGSGAQMRATCTRDECLEDNVKSQCEANGQVCVDSNTGDRDLNDWMCECTRPSTGSAVGHVAACKFDECLVEDNMKTCHHAGQAVCINGIFFGTDISIFLWEKIEHVVASCKQPLLSSSILLSHSLSVSKFSTHTTPPSCSATTQTPTQT